MEKKLDIILKKINKIELDIADIKNELNSVKDQTTKMGKHVDFVNNVYTKVEAPLNYVTDKFHTLIGGDYTVIKELE